MKRVLVPLLTCAALTAACSNQPDQIQANLTAQPEESALQEHGSAGNAPAKASTLTGPILETMDSGGYTYVRLDLGEREVWAAAPPTRVSLGQVVTINDPMPMQDFASSTLGREFELIYFASSLTAPGAAPVPHGSSAPPAATGVGVGDVAKAEGGQTVEEVILGKDSLVGKEILVRAKVVKFTPAVMGKNWLHVQDGSGTTGSNDLTVTTDAEVAVGDVVVVRGVLAADKDFGFGYAYDLIVEEARVTAE